MRLDPERVRGALARVSQRTQPMADHVQAAVLLLLRPITDDILLLYIRRSLAEDVHSGQIGFPGGVIEPTDASSLAAAARETVEEIGVSAASYEFLGDLGLFSTMTTGFDVAVHVAWLSAAPVYRCDPREVAEVLEVPLSQLVPQHGNMPPHFTIGPDTIWGMTARATARFMEILEAMVS